MSLTKYISVILLCIFLSSCGTILTVKNESFVFNKNDRINVICPNDNLELKPELETELEKLGFSMSDSADADLYFKLSYDYYFDVFHNTSNLINIIVTNKHNEVVLTSGFTGDTPSSSSGLVERVIADISKNIQIKK